MIKLSLQLEDVPIVNMYALNVSAFGYWKHLSVNLKGDMDTTVIIMGTSKLCFYEWIDQQERKSTNRANLHNRSVRPNWYPQSISSQTWCSSGHGSFS